MAHANMIWPWIDYRDAPVAIEFLTVAFGFVVTVVHRTGDHVEHAELLFPEGGGVMLGSVLSDGTPFERLSTGSAGVYIANDDPAGVYRAATGAGVKVVRAPDPEARAQGFIVADREGNLWSFGTYRGEAR